MGLFNRRVKRAVVNEEATTGVVWIKLKPGVDQEELERAVTDFLKINEHIFTGGKYHFLGHIEDGRALMDKFEQSLGIKKERVLDQ